jgi:hypothetical protein
MATIEIRKQHRTTQQDAAARSRALLEDFADRRRDIVHEIRWDPTGRSADVRGRGFSGTCSVDDRLVLVAIKLKLIARPFRGRIESTLTRKFDEEFGA